MHLSLQDFYDSDDEVHHGHHYMEFEGCHIFGSFFVRLVQSLK